MHEDAVESMPSVQIEGRLRSNRAGRGELGGRRPAVYSHENTQALTYGLGGRRGRSR